jgi:peroxiredoxin
MSTTNRYVTSLAAALGTALGLWLLVATEPAGPDYDFTLPDVYDGKSTLSQFENSSAFVIIFTGIECPVATSYTPRLNELAQRYQAKRVRFLGLDSNQQDTPEALKDYVSREALLFPLLKDCDNIIADRFKARRTPTAFVLDASRRLRYHGAIDDQYEVGVKRAKPSRHYLEDAIKNVLAGRAVSPSRTEPHGCLIGRGVAVDRASPITYSNQIARLFQAHCIECHRPGQSAPFSLTTYQESAGWAASIAEAVENDRMPPWHADAHYGTFSNERRLTEEERRDLLTWVAAGAPEGNPADTPPTPTFTDGWQITPDYIVHMSDKPFTVPANGPIRYQYFLVEPHFTEDKWIHAAECMPGNRRVVHHILVIVQPPSPSAEASGNNPSDYLVAGGPGSGAMILPGGMAKHVPAGSKLLFQIHYTPTGKPESDLSNVGLQFVDSTDVQKEVYTLSVNDTRFRIAPNDPNYRVETRYMLTRDYLLISMLPHMHLRGKRFRCDVECAQEHNTLLLVPNFDFNWQHTYQLNVPMALSAGTTIRCIAQFDNSAANVSNPDPNAVVTWGEDTTDEMMTCWFELAVDRAN